MPDPVNRVQIVAYADDVQPTPGAVGNDACVDLEVKVAVRVAGAEGEFAYDGRLDLLYRDWTWRSEKAWFKEPGSLGRVGAYPVGRLPLRLDPLRQGRPRP